MTADIIRKQQEYIELVRQINEKKERIQKYSSRTFGCQMNENDSERISGILEEMGYLYEYDLAKCDIIFLNTCCVRESAEEKLYGWLGMLKKLKEKKPDLVICLSGCMVAQEDAVNRINVSYPHVDIITGTDDYVTVPEKLYVKITEGSKQTAKPEFYGDYHMFPYISRNEAFRADVTIMKGCDNFCSYCIVPYVRGRESSRNPEDIIAEIRALAANGCREVTLLGQNVNSYENETGEKDSFTRLLYEISDIKGIRRIRFMTSHPKDLSFSLIEAVRDLEPVCRHIHLPLQSGSTRILKDMNRKYSKEDYLGIISSIRSNINDIVITSDIMVGFPGETEEDFLHTLDAVEKACFDNSYMFIYSPRKGTAAAERKDMPDEKTVKDRFGRLLELQNGISYRENMKMIGRIFEVLVEGESKTDRRMLTGRTEGGKLVHFEKGSVLPGEFANVKITAVKSFSAEGVLAV